MNYGIKSKSNPQHRSSRTDRPTSKSSHANPEEACMLIPVPELFAAWIAYCLTQDLHRWGPERDTQLSKEDALGFLYFLVDLLPPRLRRGFEVPIKRIRSRSAR